MPDKEIEKTKKEIEALQIKLQKLEEGKSPEQTIIDQFIKDI
jgi:hypothetical protein